MTEQQIVLVQRTFRYLLPIGDTVAELFYRRLFELDPTVRPLFRGDLKEQGRKLMQMLAIAVQGLSRLERIQPAVEDLGRRHAAYGVRVEHYDTVGKALLDTVHVALGDVFTRDVYHAWAAAYDALAGTMQRAGGANA